MSTVWAEKHSRYAASDWINKPSIFAETATTYLPKKGKVLELGAGQGQDSRFFAEQGYEVVSTDLEQSALDLQTTKLSESLVNKIRLQRVDLRKPLPFADDTFDVVYTHLSLHYFTDEATRRLLTEIKRVLVPGGVLAFLVNSTADPEAVAGTEIEPNYRQIEQNAKRFFTVQMARAYAAGFTVKLLDNQGETYKDQEKGVHNLVRFIGIKPSGATR